MTAPNASWPAPLLVGALARAQWGALDGRTLAGSRAVLRALVDLLPHRSAAGRITAAQVADAAGLSVRWARHCLHQLERDGFVTWSRGWLQNGRPRPGWIRLEKAAVVDALLAARGDGRAEQRRQARAAGLADRLKQLRRLTIKPGSPYRPLSRRAEVSSAPSHVVEYSPRLERPPAVTCQHCGRLRGPHAIAIRLRTIADHPWSPS